MKRIVKSIFVSTILMAVAGTSMAADKALIIGVGEYPESGHNLAGIDLDVGMMQEVAQHLGIAPSNIHQLSNQQATRENILRELDNIANTTSSSDRVFIYYSGHGSQVKDTTGDEPDNLDETWFVYDGHLIDDEINQALAKIKSNDMVVLIDSCHSGTGTKSLAANRFSQNRQQVQVKSIGYDAKITDKNFAVRATDNSQPSLQTVSQKYVSIGAAQDDEQSLATKSGSIFTKSLYESFEKVRQGEASRNWRTIYDLTANKIKNMPIEENKRFSPKLEGDATQLNKLIQFAPVTATIAVNKQRAIDLVNQFPKTLKIDAPSTLNVGDKFSFTVTSPTSGYLNVITVGADDSVTVLFPNNYARNNQVNPQTLQMPGNGMFDIVATEPRGETLVAAFVTQQPVDLTTKGFGILDANGKLNDSAFAKISGASIEKTMSRENLQRNLAAISRNMSDKPPAVANFVTVNIK